LANAEITVNSLRNQIASVPQTIASDQLPTISERGMSGGSGSVMSRLTAAEQTLSDLRSRFTDNHPDVIATKELIAQLQKQINQASAPKSGPPAAAVGVPNPVYVDLRTRLSNAQVQLAILQHRVSVAAERLQSTKSNSVAQIAIQNQYNDLDRDYGVLQENYAQLVKSREAARMSQAMSDQQQSIAFRIIQPPKRTQFPVSPPRLLLNSVVFLAGLGIGVGCSILLSLFGGRFTTSTELAEYFSLPIVGVVTAGANAAAARRHTLTVALAASSFVALVLLYGAVAVLLRTSIYTKLGI